jgi:uncharacterized membrane protein
VFRNWLLNALNFLFPALAVLVIVIAQLRLARQAAALESGALKDALQRHNKRVTIAMALLAAWLVVQYLPLVYP